MLVDIWDVTRQENGKLTIVASMSPSQLSLLFMGDEFEMEVLIENLSEQIMGERTRLQKKKQGRRQGTDPFFDDFQTYQDIHAYYIDTCAAFPGLCSITTLGETLQGRDILGVRINSNNTRPGAPKIFWECQIHAREWISAPTCAWQFTQLLEGFVSNNPDALTILDNFIVLIVPIVNPDGYVYTWTNDRMWRKNRNQVGSCMGVDLNRNWPSHWQSASGCGDTYPGPSRASELETRAIGAWIEAQGNVQFMIDFHAYGELILRPWGNEISPTVDETFLSDLGANMRDCIRAVHNNQYTSQRSAALYPANGETTDYYYDTIPVITGNQKTKSWGFTFELRGNSFVIDADEIIPQGEEIWAGMVCAAEQIAAEPPQ